MCHLFVAVANSSWIRPHVDILDTELSLIDYATELTLACKVTGYPKPSIRWEDGNEVLTSEVFIIFKG